MKKFLAIIFIVVLFFGVMSAIASFLCDIDPLKSYSWFWGIWHGTFAPYNYVRSWFTDAYVEAPIHTTAYGVFFWVTAVGAFLSAISQVIKWTLKIAFS